MDRNGFGRFDAHAAVGAVEAPGLREPRIAVGMNPGNTKPGRKKASLVASEVSMRHKSFRKGDYQPVMRGTIRYFQESGPVLLVPMGYSVYGFKEAV